MGLTDEQLDALIAEADEHAAALMPGQPVVALIHRLAAALAQVKAERDEAQGSREGWAAASDLHASRATRAEVAIDEALTALRDRDGDPAGRTEREEFFAHRRERDVQGWYVPESKDKAGEKWDRMMSAHDAEVIERAAMKIRDFARRCADAQREHDLAEGLPLIGTSTANEAEWHQRGNWAHTALMAQARLSAPREARAMPEPTSATSNYGWALWHLERAKQSDSTDEALVHAMCAQARATLQLVCEQGAMRGVDPNGQTTWTAEDDPTSPLWCANDAPHRPHRERNEFNGWNECSGRPEMTEQTPEQVVAEALHENFNAARGRGGVSPVRLAEHVVAALREAGMLVGEAEKRKWQEEAWDEGFNSGFDAVLVDRAIANPKGQDLRRNPYREGSSG